LMRPIILVYKRMRIVKIVNEIVLVQSQFTLLSVDLLRGTNIGVLRFTFTKYSQLDDTY
jgi:hypothetical protein